MKKRILILICFCCFGGLCHGQNKKVDSLLRVLKTAKEDTTKANTLIALANSFASNNPDTSVYFANEALALATKSNNKLGIADAYFAIGRGLSNLGKSNEALKNLNEALKLYDELPTSEKTTFKSKIFKGKGKVYTYIGFINDDLGNWPEGLKNYFAALRIYQEIGYKKGIANTYNNIGVIYREQGIDAEALKNYFAALKLYEDVGDKIGKAADLGNIGLIYYLQGNYAEALKNHFAALKINEELGNKREIAGNLSNIGVVYDKQGKYDEALKNYFAALKLNEESGNKLWEAINLNNIGMVYFSQGDYANALKNHIASLKIAEEMGYKDQMASCFTNIGNDYVKQKKPSEASWYLNKGLLLAKEISSVGRLEASYYGLSSLDSAQGKFKQSLENYKMYITYHDSMFNRENTKKIEQSKMQYEFDKRRLADSLTNEKDKLKREVSYKENLHKKNTQRNIFLFGGLAILVLAGGLWKRLREIRRSKAIIQKEKERSEELLLNILPYEVAEELKQTGHCQAKTFSMVTVMFTDFKDFTNVSEKVSAELLVDEINFCFSAFDRIVQKYKVEKIKTVGDAYICVSGLPVLNYTHAFDVVSAAIEIRNFMLTRKQEKEARGELPFELRIGIHTGPVVAGIVGVKKFQYDIWGDTVNLAARMESSGEAGQVNISGTTYALVKDKYNCTHRGKIKAKNKGEIDMYFVESNLFIKSYPSVV